MGVLLIIIFFALLKHLMEKFAECVQDSEQLKSALLEMKVKKISTTYLLLERTL